MAATSVLVSHIGLQTMISDTGVVTSGLATLGSGLTLFFALSGFLLYRPFVRAILHDGSRPTFRGFLRNRALRILPAYWVILLISSFVLNVVGTHRGSQFVVGRSSGPREVVENMLLVQQFHPGGLGGVGPAWSLTVEACFYLILPLLVVLALRAASGGSPGRRRWAAFLPAIVLLIVGWGGKAFDRFVIFNPLDPTGRLIPDWHWVFVHSFFEQADLFAFGMALAVIRVEWENGRVLRNDRWRRPAALGAGLIVVLAANFEWQHFGALDYRLYDVAMAVACAGLLALVVIPRLDERPTAFVRLLETRPLVWIGLISYSVYLWHQPIQSWLEFHGHAAHGTNSALLHNIAVTVVLVGLASTATYWFIERPVLRRKSAAGTRRRRRPAPPGSGDDVAPRVLAVGRPHTPSS